MIKSGLTFHDIMTMIDSIDNISEQERVEAKLEVFNKFIKWSNQDYIEYEKLLDKLKKIRKKKNVKTGELGKALEEISKFIIDKSFFYKVHPNKRTSTNEIDLFVVMSERGKQALKDYGFSEELLFTSERYFLCECKNYKKKVASTWIGKFNTLLDTCGDSKFGIVFSVKGFTGKENGWYDAHGLVKTIYIRGQANNKRYIIDFNMKEFEMLSDRKINIFQIINNKKKGYNIRN